MNPPSLQQVIDYIKERNSPIDPVAFHAYYEMLGWRCCQGKAKMVRWQSAVVTWEQKEKQRIVGNKPIQCHKCGDNGTLPNHEICSCPRGSEAKQARIVMARIKATVSQLGRSYDFPSTAAPKARRVELQNQAQLFLEASPKAAYSPTQDFQARREQLKAQAEQIRKV